MIKICKASLSHDQKKIIELIYKTDPFIYPAMCNNDYAYFKNVMLNFLRQDSIFSYNNITLAEEDGVIIGLILAFKNYQKLPVLFELNTVEIWDCLNKTLTGYFQNLLNKLEPNALYINNLCIDGNYRNMGVGRMLLTDLLKKSQKTKILLDCLEDNYPAIALYQKCGFKIMKRFEGFSGDSIEKVSCVELAYQPEF